VLTLIVEGKSTKEAAYSLGIAFKTACCHRCNLLRKLEARNTAELIRNAHRFQLVFFSGAKTSGPLHDRVRTALDDLSEERKSLADSLTQSRELRLLCAANRRDFVTLRKQLHENATRLMDTMSLDVS
jgi:hypothetical protein